MAAELPEVVPAVVHCVVDDRMQLQDRVVAAAAHRAAAALREAAARAAAG